MNDQKQKTEADSIADIARKNIPMLETVNLAGFTTPIVAHLPTFKREFESLERFFAMPKRKRGTIAVRDHASFIEYVAAHAEDGTTIFAEVNEVGGNFTAILDYHLKSKSAEGEPVTAPRWGDHVCKYLCEHTPEWKRWNKLSGEFLSQTAMATFIEENLFDLIDPAPARMLDLVKSLEATEGVEFKSAVRLDNGDRQLQYAHRTNARAGEKGDMEIPQTFKLRFAVFTNGPAYDIVCRFRYRIPGGQLAMGFEIVQPHKIIDLALADARNAIIETLKLPVLLGAYQPTKV